MPQRGEGYQSVGMPKGVPIYMFDGGGCAHRRTIETSVLDAQEGATDAIKPTSFS